MPKSQLLCFAFLLAIAAPVTWAEQALIAVAANFKPTARLLHEQFTHSHPQHHLQFSSASTGVLYNQIVHGAPFHALLAADTRSPQQLQQLQLGVDGTRFTYASGQLVLASKTQAITQLEDIKKLLRLHSTRIAIANPKLAPYGLAGQQVLATLSLLDDLQPTLIQGNHIGQTQQFVITGNAVLGFLPRSPLLEQHRIHAIDIPSHWHDPIQQQAILLQSGQHNQAAKDFLAFLKTPAAKSTMKQQGYRVTDLPRD